MASTETGVSLQQDTLSTVGGGPIRTINVWTTINGVPTQVQMQVVSVADANGVPMEAFPPSLASDISNAVDVLRDIRLLLANFMGVAVVDDEGAESPLQGPNLIV